MRLRDYPEHLSYSSSNAIFDCGERFRLERGYGIQGPTRWATVGGKGFHVATEYYDQALCAASDHQEDHGVESRITGHTASEMPGNTEPEPPTVTAIREALQQYEADRQEAERQLEVLSREALYEVPDKDEPPTQAVVDLWEAGFAWSIAEELIKLNHGDIKQYERDGVMPSPTRPSSDDWLASNRKKEDRGWWDTTGPTMLRDYLVWRQTSGWRTAAFNGVPAIELDISGELTEALKVKAYLDRVELHPDFTEPTPCVVDLKTSAKEPGEPDQLEWYAVMLERLGYPKPQWGAYYDARRGRIGRLHPMVKDYDYFAWKLGKAKSDRDNNGLVANTQSQWCRSCGVRPYCYAVGGSLADQVPRPWHEAAERRRISLSISPV